jgi:hypothetical protein
MHGYAPRPEASGEPLDQWKSPVESLGHMMWETPEPRGNEQAIVALLNNGVFVLTSLGEIAPATEELGGLQSRREL